MPFVFPLAVIPFGTVHESTQLLASATYASLAIAMVWNNSRRLPVHTPAAIIYLIALLPLTLCLVQLLTYSQEVRAILQPGYERLAGPLLSLTHSEARPLSLNPRKTLIEFCFIAGSIALGLAASTALQSRRNAKRLAKVIAVSAGTLSIFGMIQGQLSPDAIYWAFTSTEWRTTFGPFINNNHAAALLGACVPFSVYLAQHSKSPEDLSIWVTSLLVTLAGTVMTGSRSGIIIALVSAGVFFFTQSNRMVKISGLVSAFALLGTLFFVGLEAAMLRWSKFVEPTFYVENGLDTGRLAMYQSAEPLIWRAPFTGAGAGAFAEAFSTRLETVFYSNVEQAHNDPLELLIEYGFFPLLIWGALLLTVLTQRFVYPSNAHHRGTTDAQAAFSGSALSLMVYSLWDFPLRIGALTTLFVLCIGAIIGLNNRESSQPTKLLDKLLRITLASNALFIIGSSVFLMAVKNDPNSRFGDSTATIHQAQQLRASGDLEGSAELLRKSLQQRGFAPRAILRLAEVENELGNQSEALHLLETASIIFPTQPYIYLNLARMYRTDGQSLRAAETYRTLLEFPAPSVQIGQAWLMEALSNHPEPYNVPDLILPSRPERWCQAASLISRQFGRERGDLMYQQALEVDPDCGYQYAAALWQWKRPKEALQLLDTLPENCFSWRVRGFSHHSLNQFTEAIIELEKMRDNCSMDNYAKFIMANARVQLNDETGLRLLRVLVAEEPTNKSYLLSHVLALERFGETQNASDALEKLVLEGKANARDFDPDRFFRLHTLALRYERQRGAK